MNWTLLLDQAPGTVLFLAVCLAAAWACLVLGMRVERDQTTRDLRAGRLIVVPDEYDLEELLEPYTLAGLYDSDGWAAQ